MQLITKLGCASAPLPITNAMLHGYSLALQQTHLFLLGFLLPRGLVLHVKKDRSGGGGALVQRAI